MAACKKADDYKKIVSGGEIVYTSKVDSLKIFPGNRRVQVNWLLLGDPKITKARIYWNNGQDSLEVKLKRSGGIDTFHLIIDSLPEGPMVFDVKTFDDNGGFSVPVEAAAQVYGENYINALQNRGLNAWEMEEDGSAMLHFSGAQEFSLGEEIYYTDASGQPQMVTAPAAQTDVTLPNYMPYSLYHFSTLFLPDPLSIDTFRAIADTGFIAGIPPGRVKNK